MKQRLISLSVALILVLSLAACTGNDAAPTQTTLPENSSQAAEAVTTIQSVEAEAPEGFTTECKQAYLDIIAYNERMRGQYRCENYTNDSGMEETFSDGVMFCDLFDWDLNGTPELIIGYASQESNPYRASAIEIYTYKNGSAQLVLKEAPRHSYCCLDIGEGIGFSRSSNGNLVLRVDDVESEWDTSYSNYYQYDGNAVSVKNLGFCGTKNDDGEFITCDYYINGVPCTEDEYNKCRSDFSGTDNHYVSIKASDYSSILSFLSDESDSCDHLMFKGYEDEVSQWFLEYLAF